MRQFACQFAHQLICAFAMFNASVYAWNHNNSKLLKHYKQTKEQIDKQIGEHIVAYMNRPWVFKHQIFNSFCFCDEVADVFFWVVRLVHLLYNLSSVLWTYYQKKKICLFVY